MKYLPIRVNTLRPGAPVHFDVFIKLGDRTVHYIRENDPIEGDRIEKLKEKKVRKLLIPEESEDKYLEYLDAGLKSLTEPKAPIENRGAVANDTLVTAAENAEHNLETEKGFKTTEDQMNKILQFIQSDRAAIKSILGSAGQSSDLHQHAATVSSLSISVASKLGIKNPREIAELGIAGLLHDIGKNQLSFDPLKKRAEMTPDESK